MSKRQKTGSVRLDETGTGATSTERSDAAVMKEIRILSEAVEQSPSQTIITDATGRIEYVNRRFTELTGYEPEEVFGKNPRMFKSGEMPSEGYRRMWKSISSGQQWRGEFHNKRKDGQLWWEAASISPIRNEEGVVTHFVKVAEDITEQKRLEADLRRANEEIKDFAYIVSHDLRAPMINLRGFARELRDGLELLDGAFKPMISGLESERRDTITETLSELMPEALQFIDHSVTRMNRLVTSLLALSRVGHSELDLESIDMNELVEVTLQTLSFQVEQNHASVTVEELPVILGDRTAMEQIMANLLANAIQYRDPKRPLEIAVGGHSKTANDIFHVRDNGQGIASRDESRVFSPFRRGGKQDTPGEGMGLTFVQALVRRHGGRIWFESEPGVGTTFFLSFPKKKSREDTRA